MENETSPWHEQMHMSRGGFLIALGQEADAAALVYREVAQRAEGIDVACSSKQQG